MANSRFLLLIISLISLVGCTRPFRNATVDCAFIHDSPLRTLKYESQSALETEQFLTDIFREVARPITYHEYRVAENDMADYETFEWETEGNQYEVVLVKSKPIYTKIDLNGTITVRQAIDCLGEPESYLAYVMVHDLVVFELWYPKKGITLHNNFANEPDFRINEVTVMENVIYSKPTINSHEVKNDLLFVTLPTAQEREQALLKPWTNEWNDIVIEYFVE